MKKASSINYHPTAHDFGERVISSYRLALQLNRPHHTVLSEYERLRKEIKLVAGTGAFTSKVSDFQGKILYFDKFGAETVARAMNFQGKVNMHMNFKRTYRRRM